MSSTRAAAKADAPTLQVYEYINIDNNLELTPGHVMYFAEAPCWFKCGVETSRQLSQVTTVGQEVTLTLSSMVSCKYVLQYKDGSNYKFLAHKFEEKSDAPRILCRPIKCFDFAIAIFEVNDESKKWTAVVGDMQNGDEVSMDFEFNHNVGYVRSEIRRLMMHKKSNGEVLVHNFIKTGGESVNGRCNALKLLRESDKGKSKSEAKVIKGKSKSSAKVMKRPAALKQMSLTHFKKSQKWNQE